MIHVDRSRPFQPGGEDVPTMPEAEIEYLTRRAAQQLVLAQRATLPAVTAAHYQLATAYLDRVAASTGSASPTGPRDRP